MAWVEPEFSVQKVNAAGRALVKFYADDTSTYSQDDWVTMGNHILVINNWRAAHNYPLNTFQMSLRNSAKRFDAEPLIAQRTKRLFSVALKLARSPTMKLSQMQDIGGCRAVLTNVDHVRALVDYYRNRSRIKHHPGPVDDYISNPKESGYRGVHLIYRYFSDKKKKEVYNNLKIEMQIRSRYQHAWATAVETVGTFVGQALKTSIGDEEWLRFFALMGSAIAIREKTPTVPNTPKKRRELVDELAYLTKFLDVQARLNQYANALRFIKGNLEGAQWYLLELNPRTSELVVSGFRREEREDAEREYGEAERRVRDNPGTDAVLVSVESISALHKAYPNYFADTGVFVQLLDQALTGRARRIGEPKLRATETKPAQLSLEGFE